MRLNKQQKKIAEMVQRAAAIEEYLTTVKPLYRELDDITAELIKMNMFSVMLGDIQMTLVDNFADKNTAFRVARIKRYEIKIEKKQGTLSISKAPAKDLDHEKPKKAIFPVRKRKKK